MHVHVCGRAHMAMCMHVRALQIHTCMHIRAHAHGGQLRCSLTTLPLSFLFTPSLFLSLIYETGSHPRIELTKKAVWVARPRGPLSPLSWHWDCKCAPRFLTQVLRFQLRSSFQTNTLSTERSSPGSTDLSP